MKSSEQWCGMLGPSAGLTISRSWRQAARIFRQASIDWPCGADFDFSASFLSGSGNAAGVSISFTSPLWSATR